MNPTLKTDKNGLVATSANTAVNPNFATPEALNQAKSIAGLGSNTVPSVVNASSLTTIPKPLSIPATPVTSGAVSSINGTAQSQLDTGRNDLQQEADTKLAEAKNAKTESTSVLKDLMNKITGVQNSQGQLEQDAGIEKKTTDYNSALNRLDAVNNSEADELRSLDNSNMTDAGKQAASRDISRKYAFQRQAESFNLSVAQRDLTSAQQAVDKKIELQLEPLKTALDFQKTFYEDNRDDLSTAEQNAFNLKIQTDQRKYDTQKDNLDKIGQVQLELAKKGIILPSVNNASNYMEALKAAAPYLKDQPAISTQVVELKNGKKVLINSKTGETIRQLDAGEDPTNVLAQAQAKDNISTIDSVIKDPYLTGAVGPNPLGRLNVIGGVTGGTTNFITNVENLTSKLTLDNLINAKANGATFGALSEGELNLLSNSATKISKAAIKDDAGNVTGYSLNEKDFKKELDRINNFSKLDYILKGGNAADVDVVVHPDGTAWATNNDGTITQIN